MYLCSLSTKLDIDTAENVKARKSVVLDKKNEIIKISYSLEQIPCWHSLKNIETHKLCYFRKLM